MNKKITNGIKEKIAIMSENIEFIKEKIENIEVSFKDFKNYMYCNYVSKIEFDTRTKEMDAKILPLRNILYGMVATILILVLTALIKLII